MISLQRINKLTVEEFLNLNKVTVTDIVNYCIVHFDQDWMLIPPRIRTYKNYRYALRRTIHLWINIPEDIKNMSVHGGATRISNLSSESKSPIKSFILSIVANKISK